MENFIYDLMQTRFYRGTNWLKTRTAQQLLVEVFNAEFEEYPSSVLGADTRSQTDGHIFRTYTHGVIIISFLLCEKGLKAMKIFHRLPVRTEDTISTYQKQ
jgi:hypothetical protein